jgi:hypothetical protein
MNILLRVGGAFGILDSGNNSNNDSKIALSTQMNGSVAQHQLPISPVSETSEAPALKIAGVAIEAIAPGSLDEVNQTFHEARADQGAAQFEGGMDEVSIL